jgi:hypothetical protein
VFERKYVDDQGNIRGGEKSQLEPSVVDCTGATSGSTSAIVDEIIDTASEYVQNGNVYKRRFTVSSFNESNVIQNSTDSMTERFGSASVTRDYSHIISSLSSDIGGDETVMNAIKSLKNAGKIKLALMVAPGEDCEESEYCSVNSYEFWTTDGWYFTIEIDMTT